VVVTAVRSDRGEPARVDTRREPWVASPEPGVERVLLERDGGEVARATSIVRYAPGARFAAHTHERGEEFLVLDGEFRDEHGVYPRGTYVRNPWGSSHAPSAPVGCVLFVKLRQIADGGEARVLERDAVERCRRAAGEARGVLPLHRAAEEEAALVRLGAGGELGRGLDGSAERSSAASITASSAASIDEVYVLEGELADARDRYAAGTWLRFPGGAPYHLRATGDSLVFVKLSAA
jgi:anti-sigma factor ChrR (cupin superfamily)